MTNKVTLANLASLQNETAAVTTINANNAAITTAMNNTLSRNLVTGTPNGMQAQLDMNGFNIINLPAPSTAHSPARLEDVVGAISLTIPDVGTSGATVPLLNGNNTWDGTNVHNAAVDMTAAGTVTAPTPTTGDNTANVATTAFVQASLPVSSTIAGLSVVGRSANSTGATAAITGTANQFLGVNATPALAFETMTGDATLAAGALTLQDVNSNVGSFGSASSVPTITANAKGLITAASTSAVVAPAGTLSGTSLNSTVINSSLQTTSTTVALGADSAAPGISTVHGQDVLTGTNNQAGANLVVAGSKGTGTGAGGSVIVQTAPAGSTGTTKNAEVTRVTVDAPGNVVVGSAILATTATNGFLYIPSCAGPPTGVPTTYGGRTPMIYDATNNKLYIYNTAWKSVTLA